jgi:hypothetical protein
VLTHAPRQPQARQIYNVGQKMNKTAIIELHDSKTESTAVRFACVIFGALGLYAAIRGFPNIGAIFAGFISVCLISVWFLRARIVFNSENRELIWRSTMLGSHRTDMKKAVAISAYVGGTLTKSGSIYVHFPDGCRMLAVTVAANQAVPVATKIAQAASLPLHQE